MDYNVFTENQKPISFEQYLQYDENSRIILTVSEDADCSGLPVLGETVCNYDSKLPLQAFPWLRCCFCKKKEQKTF